MLNEKLTPEIEEGLKSGKYKIMAVRRYSLEEVFAIHYAWKDTDPDQPLFFEDWVKENYA